MISIAKKRNSALYKGDIRQYSSVSYKKMYPKTSILVCSLFYSIVFISAASTTKEYGVPQNVELQGFIEDIINSSLSKIISNIPDPIRVPYLGAETLNITHGNDTLISGKFNVSNLRLEGLRGTKVSSLSCNAWAQSLNITMRFFDVSTRFKYWTDVVLLELVPLYGSGINTIIFEEFQLYIYAKATLEQNWGLNIKNLTAILNLGSVSFDLNGLLNDPVFSALVNTVLKDNLPSFINDHQEFITRILSPIVKGVLNQLMHSNATFYNIEEETDHKFLEDAQKESFSLTIRL